MKIKIGVTGTGSLIGQAIIKSIRLEKNKTMYELIGFDYFKETIGSYFCSKNYILPDIYKHPELKEDWLNKIIDSIYKEKIKILFIGVDFELLLFSKNKSFIESSTGCKIIVSPESVINIGNDKYLTYEFLKKNGLIYPDTFLPNEIDYRSLNFPVIVKPRIGARSRGVFLVDSIEKLKKVISTSNNPIIQEYIGNENSEYTCGIICLDGEVKSSIILKRSLKEGNTSIAEFNNNINPRINKYINDIAIKLMPYGSCNLQLRLDNSGNPKLFEINPRHSGTTYMRALFGFNEVLYIINNLIFNSDTQFNLKEGKCIRFYDEKIVI